MSAVASTSSIVNSSEQAAPDDSKTVSSDSQRRWPEVMFFASLAGFSAMAGFGGAIAAARRSDPNYFAHGCSPPPSPGSGVALGPAPGGLQAESGAALAARALRWGSLYAVAGVSAVSLLGWIVFGCATSWQQFRSGVSSAVDWPQVRGSNGRTEFASIRELFQYLSGDQECSVVDGDDGVGQQVSHTPQS